MPLRRARAVTFRASSLSDTTDSTNQAAGVMASLQNLIPNPSTKGNFVPRPAAGLISAFDTFTQVGQGEALFNSGDREYGFIQSNAFSGHSQPFIYDLAASQFIAITGETAANTPTSTANTGDWVPPTIAQVGAFVIFTHPGFNYAGGYAFGWLDMSGFSLGTLTATATLGSPTLTAVSSNPILAGVLPGQTISDGGTDIPANARVKSLTATTITMDVNAIGNGTPTLAIAGGTFAAPLWAAGNLNITPLVAAPVAVTQYAGSACYAVNTNTSSAVIFSDAGNPLACTNTPTSQILTLQNAVPITAMCGLPLNTLTGGIIQSLIVFQDVSAIWQITGAPATTNVALNTLNDSTGTQAPNTVVSTPKGLFFCDHDGVRLLDFSGNISSVIGRRGQGVNTPFLFAVNPTRMCAAYNEGVYRISVINGAVANTPTQEYWFHLDDQIWTGPHTFPASLITASQVPHSFIMFPATPRAAGNGAVWGGFIWGADLWTGRVAGSLWQSDAYASLAANYVENGMQMTFEWKTSLLPDNARMSMNAVIRSTLACAIPATQQLQVNAIDEHGNVIGQTQIRGTGGAPTIWGAFVWGAAPWGAGLAIYSQRNMPWQSPIVFKQMQVQSLGNCAEGLNLGNLYLDYQDLGYTLPTIGQGATL